ncbi:MAG: hypothetical protein HFI93_06125 [Lachnospiraceae bacterium]|nr:hypothetical protein [Lachnospiraceae bacterium]
MNKQNWISFNEIPRKERYRNVRLVNKGTWIALAGMLVLRAPYLMAGGQIFAANCLYGLGMVLVFRYTYSFTFGMLFPFLGKNFSCPWPRLAWQMLAGPVLWAGGMTWFYRENFAWGFKMFEIAFVITCLAYLAGAACGYRKAARRRERREEMEAMWGDADVSPDRLRFGKMEYEEADGTEGREGRAADTGEEAGPSKRIILSPTPRKR